MQSFYSTVLLLVICQVSTAFGAPALNQASGSLYVSIAGGNKDDEYLATQQDSLKNKVLDCLAKVHGNGDIEEQYCEAVTNPEPRAIHSLGDYREINGKEWFFVSKSDANGTKTWESCVLGVDRKPSNCFSMKWLDPHDMLVAENGDRIYMFYVPRVRPRVWLSGKALDLVLRRVNAKNEVVWQWSSADHVIADVKEPARKAGFGSEVASSLKQIRTSILTNLGATGDGPICVTIGSAPRCLHPHWVDYLHANSLAWDRDGGIIVSARYPSEIFKIDSHSGDIDWILGGYHAQFSDFKLLNDPLGGFSFQHSARILADGNILVFDNANGRPDQHSRAVEYEIDTNKKTATLVWDYPAENGYAFRNCCGLVQRLKNGNTLIAWGGLGDKTKTDSIPVATEVTPGGKVVFELRSNIPELPYRVWKID